MHCHCGDTLSNSCIHKYTTHLISRIQVNKGGYRHFVFKMIEERKVVKEELVQPVMSKTMQWNEREERGNVVANFFLTDRGVPWCLV
jgi:hypothetical protein